MTSLKTIFTIGVIILIFPMLGLPSGAEDAILIICGIILLVSSLMLRKEVPYKKKISKESTSFSENEIKVEEKDEDEDAVDELINAEHEDEIWDGRKM